MRKSHASRDARIVFRHCFQGLQQSWSQIGHGGKSWFLTASPFSGMAVYRHRRPIHPCLPCDRQDDSELTMYTGDIMFQEITPENADAFSGIPMNAVAGVNKN